MDSLHLLATPTPRQQLIFRENLTYLQTNLERSTLKELFANCYNETLIEDLTQPEDEELNPPSQIRSYYSAVASIVRDGMRSFVKNRRVSGLTPLPSGLTSPSEDTPRSPSASALCRLRDGGRCVITGREATDFPLEVAHIIPFGISQNTNSRQESFWKFLDIFMGTPRTDALWDYIGADNINRLENLILLDRSVHSLFDKGTVTFHPVPPLSTGTGTNPSYQIRFSWNGKKPLVKGQITTTHTGTGETAQPVMSGDKFRLSTAFPDIPLPNPILLEIHQAVNALRHIIAGATRDPFDDEAYHSDEGKPRLVTDYGGIELLTQKLVSSPTATIDLSRWFPAMDI